MGSISTEAGDPHQAKEFLEEALPLARAIRSPFVLPGLLSYIGLAHINAGEFSQAEPFFEESKLSAQQLFSAYWQSLGFLFSGGLALLRNDLGKSRADLVHGLQLAREKRSNLFLAHIEEMLGRVQVRDADLTGARLSLTESLRMLQEMSLKACLAHGLEGWARLVLANGEPQRAARILAAIHTHLETMGANLIPIEQELYDQTLEAIQQQLDVATFKQEWAEGQKLNIEEAIELATR